MSPIEEFYHLTLEAERVTRLDSYRGDPDMEPFCLRIVELTRAYPELRLDFIVAFQRIVREPGLGDWSVITLCMHILRWPEIREWAEFSRMECISRKDWRGEPVYRHILEAFDDNWEEARIFECLRK